MKNKPKTRSDFSPYTGEVVRIIWQDPLHICETTEKEINQQPDLSFTSYGVVIRDDGKRLSLAATIGTEPKDKTLREVVRVPWSLIRSIDYLEVAGETFSEF